MHALLLLPALLCAAEPADLIVHNARVVTVDSRFSIAQGIAVRQSRIAAVGTNEAVLALRGPKTRVIDAAGKMVLPGLYDSHVHPLSVVTTELADPPPVIRSLEDAFAHYRKQAARTPAGEWLVLRYAFPTRLAEGRFPTLKELDEVAPNHPVLFHAGPAGMVNSRALEVSKIGPDTPSPRAGMIVKDPKTGKPTGMIRNAYSTLRNLPRESDRVTPQARREGLKRLLARYNEQGLTSIADRNGSADGLALYRELAANEELTVRVNFAPSFNPQGTREQLVERLQGMAKKHGKSGTGDDWIRIGPLKTFLDGGMLNGTAYMRQPWPAGPTYQITESDYRGLLFISPEQIKLAAEEVARQGWQLTAHTAGEGAMDVLLDAYEHANRFTNIRPLRFCITHANFPSLINLRRCKELGVCADVQPAWLYKDGATLARLLPAERIRWFQPYKSWLQYTTIGGGSDHMLRFDPIDSTNPWSPWLGIWTALTRKTERAGVLVEEERLTREQAIRLYTINNAYLNHEEKLKGSLEVGKLGDLILIDRDVLHCPVDEVRDTRVLLTVVGGKVVYERKQ